MVSNGFILAVDAVDVVELISIEFEANGVTNAVSLHQDRDPE